VSDLTEAVLLETGAMRGLEAGSNRVREDYASGSSPSFDPLTSIPWAAAFWASDPAVTPPANGAVIPSTWNQPGSYTATEWTRVQSPTFVASWQNGKPAINFPGTGGSTQHRLTTTFAATNQAQVTVAIIGETTSSESDLMDGIDSSADRLVLDRTGGQWRMYRGSNVVSTTSDGLPHLFIARYFNDGADTLTVDGVVKIGPASVGVANAGKTIAIGSTLNNQDHAGSKVAFVGLVTGELTTQQRSDLLAWYQSYYIAPVVPTWTYDFTDDADGAPAGWTTTAGNPAVVTSGMLRCNVDWYYTQARMDTPTMTTFGRRITAEFQWSVLTEEINIGLVNAANDQLNALVLGGNGNWFCVRNEGYDGPSGTWTPPPINTTFTVEYTWSNAYGIFKVNGTKIGEGSWGNGPVDPTTAIYTRIQMGGNTGLRKVKYEQLVYSDDFNRIDTTPTAEGGAGLGPLWIAGLTDRFQIAGNKAVQPYMGFDYLAVYDASLGGIDMWAEADVDMKTLQTNQRCSLVVRRDDFFNWRYLGFMDWNGQLTIAFNGGGNYEIIAQGGSHGSATTGKLRLEIQGFTLKLYYNGTLAVTGTDAAQHSNFGKWAGMEQKYDNVPMSMDNFRCGPLPYLAPP
jgi:hypothetical protein